MPFVRGAIDAIMQGIKDDLMALRSKWISFLRAKPR